MELTSVLESLIFASDKPLTLRQLIALAGKKKDAVKSALAELVERYNASGIQLVEVSGGYQFRTHPNNADIVKKLLAGRPMRLTRPMLEALAIVAYRQPVTRPEIDEIRGVDCGGTLRVLLERNLIRVVGKRDEPGRPLLYGTTKYFLEFFSLRDLRDLPTLKEFAELTEEHTQQVEDQFGGGPATVIEKDEAQLADEGHPVVAAASEPLEGPPAPGEPVEGPPAAAEHLSGTPAQPVTAPAAEAPDEKGIAAVEIEAIDQKETAEEAAEREAADERDLDALDRAMGRAEEILRAIDGA